MADVRRGFAAVPPGRPAAPVVAASRRSAIVLLVHPGSPVASGTATAGADAAGSPADDAGAVACPVDGGRADDAHVVLIERSRTAGTHRGDIAFPGGVLQPGEEPVDGALREVWEEIGVPAADVEVIGSLDMVATQSGFVIAPFVGLLPARPALLIDRAELERAFSVPLADLAREDAHWYEALMGNVRLAQPFFTVGGDAVGWGTTGSLLVRLLTAAAAGHRAAGLRGEES
ncbi:conserved hypothetical protein [Frankia canadensis]|uniref:Nudix hydrolase domain-containing protein n=2 Tax=Frankia canadensis TaxID=1836972 RepID=A0A2I2KXG3_9ACTN|nr:conserved hypothetical protein [Frankia canadensis]SOU57636.1 conserved hypothetical protein [Frankia canadensis]